MRSKIFGLMVATIVGMCRYVAQNAQIIVIPVDFRLGPEHPTPAQVEDCISAYKWVSAPVSSDLALAVFPCYGNTDSPQCHSNASKFNGDSDKVFSFGSSLSGGVAFAVTLKLIDENLGSLVKGIVALCPAARHPFNVPEEYKSIYKAYDETWMGAPMLDGESMVMFYSKSMPSQECAKGLKVKKFH